MLFALPYVALVSYHSVDFVATSYKVAEQSESPFGLTTGAVASSLQGEPRATHDIDIVVEVRAPARDVAERLKAAFPEPDFYLDETAVREAIGARGMFNVIDAHEGDEVDFWLLTDDAYDRARFERRDVVLFESTELSVSRPEDTILMKLRWAAMLGVTAALARVRAEAQPIE